ncbi:hypothetical protein TK5_09050 [Sideroxyarcus sp. TK5]
MNKGSRLWIISDEMSISRLTKPSTQTPRGMRDFERLSFMEIHADHTIHSVIPAQAGIQQETIPAPTVTPAQAGVQLIKRTGFRPAPE